MAAALALCACGGGGDDNGDGGVVAPPRVDPGLVDVVLETPNANDGAVLLQITGGPVTAVQAAGPQLRSGHPSVNPLVVLVRGDLTNGVIARLELPDRNRLTSYAGQVTQVVARGTYAQRALDGYRVVLRKP